MILTLIGACVVLIICGVCTHVAITCCIEAREENKALEDLLKRSKENDKTSKELIEKQLTYLKKYQNN